MPEFKDARTHDPSSIVLLCPSCHALATKGIIPKEQVAEASARPAAIAAGYSSKSLPFFKGIPSLKMGGGALIEKTPIPIEVGGRPLISFFPSENGSDVTQISFLASDAIGSNFLEVIDNEWRIKAGNWDFEWKGKRFIFKISGGDPVLVMRLEPPQFIAIEVFRTSINGTPIEINESFVRIGERQCPTAL